MKKLFPLFCLGAFVIIVGVFFYPTFIQGKLPVPSDSLVGLYHPWRDLYAKDYPRGIPFKNFLITDPVRQQIPWRKIAIDQWKQGRIPKWNPYSFSGAPLAANIQAAVYYPLNILFFFFDFPVAWTILIILEPLLAGIFLYLYLRHHQLDPLACLLGAVAWSFSGFFVAWLTWGTMVHVALWLPLVLLAIDKLVSKARFAWLVVFVAGLTMQVFAGHMQIALYSTGIAFAYAVYRLYQKWSKRGSNVLWIMVGIGAFILITSIQWFPMIKLVLESSRIGETGWPREGWFIPWQHLTQFLVPDFFGNPTTLNYWGAWNYGELVGYIGVIPLLFVLHNVFSKKNKDSIFWFVALVVALLFSLPTPLAKLPYQLGIPVLSSLQPTRLMVIVDFALVMLAAYGFDGWMQKKDRRIWPVVITGVLFVVFWGVVLMNGGENFQVSKRNLILPTGFFFIGSLIIILPTLFKKVKMIHLFGIILIGITAFDLLRFGWKFTPFTSREYFFSTTAVIDFLQKQEKPFRVMSTDKRIMPPNVSAYYGIETIEGYDPLISGRYEELMAAIGRGKSDITPPFGFNRIIVLETVDSPLLPMLNVRYVLILADIERPFLNKVFQEGETRVYEYTTGLPRAFFVSNVRKVSNKEEAIRELFDPSFSPENTAIVEGFTESENTLKGLTKGVTSITDYSPESISVETELPGDGYLVVAGGYTSDWSVRIDGISKPVYRTNYDSLGALVPAGTHRVEFSL